MTGFHGDVVAHIARRGLQVVNGPVSAQSGEPLVQAVPTWGKALLASTLLTFGLLLLSLRYTLWGIVPTLTAIETPQTTVVVKDEKPKLTEILAEENIDEEIMVIKHKPITAKIRTTMKHLQARAGRLSRWRGISIFVVYMMLHGLMTEFIQTQAINLTGLYAYGFTGAYAGRVIGSVLASGLLARLSLTWTHIVVSEPSPKPWYRRVPSHKAWKNVWAATAAFDLASRLPFVLPMTFVAATGVIPSSESPFNNACRAMQAVSLLLMGAVAFFGLTIPAYVALVRVQASMLPEENEGIVPFDRSFNGKVVPQVLGGTGAIGYLAAWKSFDKAGRLRMLKLVVKNIMIETALHVFFAGILVSEVIMIFGPENIRKLIDDHRSQASA